MSRNTADRFLAAGGIFLYTFPGRHEKRCSFWRATTTTPCSCYWMTIYSRPNRKNRQKASWPVWIEYNPNPAGRKVGDCAVRAVAKALDTDWETAYELIAEAGYNMADMPSSDAVWGAVLRGAGFYRQTVPNTCPDCYTAEEFAEEHPRGIFVLGFGGHVATVEDGVLYDSWDSSQEIPIYFWYRKNGGR